jgi:hypothetical protein
VWYVVGNWIAQWKNDISIWENKVWQLKPILVKEDGPVQKLRRCVPSVISSHILHAISRQRSGTDFACACSRTRRWYAQFYSNKSAVEKNTLEW